MRIIVGLVLIIVAFALLSITSIIYEPEPIRCSTVVPLESNVLIPILYVIGCVSLIITGVVLIIFKDKTNDVKQKHKEK